MPVQRVIREVSHREYLAWMAWFDEQLNQPDRHDFYQMQTALEVRRMMAKNPSKYQMADMKLKIEKEKPKPPLTKERAAAISKQLWKSRLGL
jgi:hypothetical protein